MATRFEKAVNGLKKIADRYNKHEVFEFSKDYITIRSKADKAIWIWIFIIFFIVTPVGIIIYLMTQNSPDTLTIALLIGLASYFSVILYSLLNGQQNLTVDLPRKQFVLESVHNLFTRQRKPIRIDFAAVQSVTLKEKSLSYKNKWTRIGFIDKEGRNLGYLHLGADFPDSIIAEKVKFFFDVILWTFNEKKQKSA